MKESAASEKRTASASVQRKAGASSPLFDEPGARNGPLMSMVQRAGCSGCAPALASLAGRMAEMPAGSRKEAALSLQRTKGNRFVQGLTVQAKEQATPNKTGMPDQLKSGLENISGLDLSGVRVHYSSSKPAQLNALAYTQGQEIHVAPGQEKHLPHEGWHVVQQAQGRVKPTMQMKDGVPVNDDEELEREADVMGGRALWKRDSQQTSGNTKASETFSALAPIQRYCVLLAGDAQTQSHRLTGATSQYDAQTKTHRYQPVWSTIPQGQVSLRVADQGGLAIPHTGQDEFETFFARPALLDTYNQNLQNTAFTLVPRGNTVTTPMNPLAAPNGATEQLQEEAVDLNHGTEWARIKDDCNDMAAKVTGKRNTTDVANRDIPEIGEALHIRPLMAQLEHNWDYHWAGVVAKVGSDVVTLENYARGNVETQLEQARIKAEKGWGILDWLLGVKRLIAPDGMENQRYYFSMYGPDHTSQGAVTNPKQSFEAEWAPKFPGTGVTTNVRTHQAAQRQGQVRNPFGVGIVVLQDQALEAESVWLGQRAVSYETPVQAKVAPGVAQRSSSVTTSPPISAGPDSVIQRVKPDWWPQEYKWNKTDVLRYIYASPKRKSDAIKAWNSENPQEKIDVEEVERYLKVISTQPKKPPFGTMRFSHSGQGTGMQVMQNDMTGFIVKSPRDHLLFGQGDPNRDDSNTPADQLSAGDAKSTGAFGIGREYLTKTSKRDRQQGEIQGELSTSERTLSATQIAKEIGLEKDAASWEWLHLIAFSIGPNRVLDLSATSEKWLEKSDQTAQITENLILGTKEANSAMLTFETFVKSFLKQFPSCSLNLAVFTTAIEKIYVPKFGATVPVADKLKFDYFFTAKEALTAPTSIEFDLLSHGEPTFEEFHKMCETAARNASAFISQTNMPVNMGSGMMDLT